MVEQLALVNVFWALRTLHKMINNQDDDSSSSDDSVARMIDSDSDSDDDDEWLWTFLTLLETRGYHMFRTRLMWDKHVEQLEMEGKFEQTYCMPRMLFQNLMDQVIVEYVRSNRYTRLAHNISWNVNR